MLRQLIHKIRRDELEINPDLVKHKELVDYCIRDHNFKSYMRKVSPYRSSNQLMMDKKSEYQNLTDDCKTHQNRYSKKLDADNMIMLAHPFYVFTTDKDHLDSEDKHRQADSYAENLCDVLSADYENTQKIIFDTYHHYAACSSHLLEKGYVDKVIFSQYDSGVPKNRLQFWNLRKKDIYLGGMYNGNCFSAMSQKLWDMRCRKLWVLPHLILDHPTKDEYADFLAPCDISLGTRERKIEWSGVTSYEEEYFDFESFVLLSRLQEHIKSKDVEFDEYELL